MGAAGQAGRGLQGGRGSCGDGPSAVLYHSSGKEPLRLLRGSQADGRMLPWERPARDEPPLFKLPDRLEDLSEAELYALGRGARFICELEAIWKEIDRRRALGQKAEP